LAGAVVIGSSSGPLCSGTYSGCRRPVVEELGAVSMKPVQCHEHNTKTNQPEWWRDGEMTGFFVECTGFAPIIRRRAPIEQVKGEAGRGIKEQNTAFVSKTRNPAAIGYRFQQRIFKKSHSIIDVVKFWRNLPTKGSQYVRKRFSSARDDQAA